MPNTPVPAVANAISLYDRISDPMDAVNKLGVAFAQSKMFGCSNESQGRVLAMHCLAERKSPVALMREYHLIGGNLTMKADVMLAKFRQAGGSHIVLERSANRAATELKYKRQTLMFEFTWEEAKKESYVYCKDKTLKDNWNTPRRRMQMLWARLISDAVRAVCPEAVAGHYTPEDLDVPSEPDNKVDASGEPSNGVIDAEFTVTEEPAAEAKAPEFDRVPPQESAKEAATEDPPPLATEPQQDRGLAVTEPEPDNVTADQLQQMKAMKVELGYGDEVWKQVLDRFGVTTAKDLTYQEAYRVVAWLIKRIQDSKEKKTAPNSTSG